MIAQAFIEPSTIASAAKQETKSKMLHRSTTTGFLRAIPKRIEIPLFRRTRQNLSCPALHSKVLDNPLDKSVHSVESIDTVSSTSSWLIDQDGEDFMIESEVGINFPTHNTLWYKKPYSLMSTLNIDMNKMFTYKPRVVGHRGTLYRSLENTRHSIRLAAQHCHEVEIDVFLLKCGTLIVFHGGGNDQNPGCLKEYCNRDGSILDLTYEEARALKFNHNHPEFGCGPDVIKELEHECYIPTLREVLSDAKETGVVIKVELKGPGTPDPVLKLVEEMDMVDKVHYSSFDHSRIKRVRELRPDRNPDGSYRYKTGALFDEPPEDFVKRALDAGASEVHLKYNTCTSQRVERIHNAGMDSMVWMRGPVGMSEDVDTLYKDVGNEDENMYLAIMKTGVKAMCVNKPEILANLLMKHNALLTA